MESDEEVDFTQRKGPLREWLVLDRIRKQVGKQFKHFLNTYEDGKGNLIYPSRISVRQLLSFNVKFPTF